MGTSRRDDQADSRSGARAPDSIDRAADHAGLDGEDLSHILNSIPEAWGRAQESISQAKCRRTVPVREL
jgi:hypothetical protein